MTTRVVTAFAMGKIRKLVISVADKFDKFCYLRGFDPHDKNPGATRADYLRLVNLLDEVCDSPEDKLRVLQLLWIAAAAEWSDSIY